MKFRGSGGRCRQQLHVLRGDSGWLDAVDQICVEDLDVGTDGVVVSYLGELGDACLEVVVPVVDLLSGFL